MKKEFVLGQKVLVKTGSGEAVAIIDYPNIRKDLQGNNRPFKRQINGQTSYLCRFTDNIKRCHVGGAYRTSDRTEGINYLCELAYYIPEEIIFEYNK
jgi:hypothetical protein